jgi:hypothetical protein
MEFFDDVDDFDSKRTQLWNGGWAVRVLFFLEVELCKRLFFFVAFGDDCNFSPVWGGLPYDRIGYTDHWSSGVKV